MKIKNMPEVTITYEKPETLKLLKALAEYLDFKIIEEKDDEVSANNCNDNTKRSNR